MNKITIVSLSLLSSLALANESATLKGTCAVAQNGENKTYSFELKKGEYFNSQPFYVKGPFDSSYDDEYTASAGYYPNGQIAVFIERSVFVCNPPVLTPVGTPPQKTPCDRPNDWTYLEGSDVVKNAENGAVISFSKNAHGLKVSCLAVLN